MDNSLSREATHWREGRRSRAWELKKKEGWSQQQQQQIADALGLSKGAVSLWMKRARRGGVEALKRRIAPGATPRLSEKQRQKLPELLARGAEAHGFRGDVFEGGYADPERVQNQLPPISREPLTQSSRAKSAEKPECRAKQRDEHAIEHWKEQRGGPS